jgi:hypothetical protein
VAGDFEREVMLMLGRLDEGQERQRKDFDEEKRASSESRGRVHAKLEKIEEDVSIVGQVAAQARDKANTVEQVVIDDVKPVTDEIKKARLKGIGALWAIGIMATVFGFSAATVAGDVITWARRLLRIE